MICSSVKRFFTSNLLGLRDWTPNRRATQKWGDVDDTRCSLASLTPELSRAAKRRRLERIVRPLMRHRSEDPTVVHGKPRAEAVILQFPRTDMAHNLLGTNV